MQETIAEIRFAVNYTVDREEFTPEQLKFIEAQALIQLREWIGTQHESWRDHFVLDIDFEPPVGLFPEDDNKEAHAVLLRGAGAMQDIMEGFVSQLEDEIGKRDGSLP
jgi:hypothetical protein